MTLEFIGHVGARSGSDVIPPRGPVVDKAYIRELAQSAERSNFDRLLIGSFSTTPDNNQIAAFVLHETTRLGVMLAHRTGFVAPTMAARQLATLDHFADGRLGVHIISGGTDEDQQRDGDFLEHDERYARTDEYLDVVRRVWTSAGPFDHEGRFYRAKGAFSVVKPLQPQGIPVYFGGSSDAAIEVAGKHADVYALWGEPLDQTAETIARVRASAARHGREGRVRFVLAFRPVVEDTEEAAWARTRELLEIVRQPNRPVHGGGRNSSLPMNVGSQRLRQAAARGKVLDKRLWTELAGATGASGNSTALVGTADQVADALLDYHALGVTSFLIRCFDPLRDTPLFGREVIPRVRAALAARALEPALSA
ncbi:LLM class flavin-dependent oxidoreductase [Paucibacter sp. R3-3]|uniref:LLM class flavin-dependent oxidoreductase n=1 Tax=Roseateles agri TaxID=3098619 RepID=A0ABU5DMZ2_9BURK|nr:LLM class flavin-dependent oxidoreductase [Paucibacter sp. R3-3]MDY0747662.1 LLM class flavin-dependent oxidoreductase [Paucibacter sp. R3-3]